MDLKFKVKNCIWLNEEHTEFTCDCFYEVFNSWIKLNCSEKSLSQLGDEIWKVRDELEIAEFEDKRDLNQEKVQKINKINFEKNNLLNKGNVKFKDDVFDIDDTSLLRISGTIQDWKDQISNGLDEENISQKWISQTNKPVDLTYVELVELARKMRLEVQNIVFYANALKEECKNADSLEKLDAIKWNY